MASTNLVVAHDTSDTERIPMPVGRDASEPPEARGIDRDGVRLLVSDVACGTTTHARFTDLPRWLHRGDVLVVNTSGTLNASVAAETDDGERVELHLSTRLPGGFWSVEVRKPGAGGTEPYPEQRPGRALGLPAGGAAHLLAPYPASDLHAPSRLWLAALDLPDDLPAYLTAHGSPIRYRYVGDAWPSEVYQTVFANQPGSAEMPSAGRPFSASLVTRLVTAGVQFAPLLLHTGVASQEDHEPPYEEFYRVPRATADLVNAARRAGRRVIGVGTTAVRALESVTDERGDASAGSGWTDLVVSPGRPLRIVNGIISGLHEPHATHLLVLEQAIVAASVRSAGRPRLRVRAAAVLREAYDQASREGYLWHEFGDSHLIVGGVE